MNKRTTTRPMENLLVANEKGGIGKTSLSYCLANCLTTLGYQVLLVDMDPSGHLSNACTETVPELTLSDVFDEKVPLTEIIQKTAIADIAPTVQDKGKKSLTRISTGMVGVMGSEYSLLKILRKSKDYDLNEYYDFCIIDSGPSNSNLTTNAIIAADTVLVPSELGSGSNDGIHQFNDSVEKVREFFRTNVIIDGVVIVKYAQKHGSDRRILPAIYESCENLGFSCYETKIRDSSPIKSAIDDCRPILDYLSNGSGATDSMNLALEFLARRGLEPLKPFHGITRKEDGRLTYQYPTRKNPIPEPVVAADGSISWPTI